MARDCATGSGKVDSGGVAQGLQFPLSRGGHDNMRGEVRGR